MELSDVTYQSLRDCTNGFSEHNILGEGSYGRVYRGVMGNGKEIAVKLFFDAKPMHDDITFKNEFGNLAKLEHPNIVQIIGYCYEKRNEIVEYNGMNVSAEKTYRALCFEYLHNGSLKNHLSEELSGLDWQRRYKIIRGTCEALKYIHEDLKPPIYHLDIKPENILLDKNMEAKLADFGLSKVFRNVLTRSTTSSYGTIGYLPPEYINRNKVSKKFDIFSLGVVIIKIVTGPDGYAEIDDMTSKEFIDQVQRKWKERMKATWSGCSLEAYGQQVARCIQIGLNCLHEDRKRRPGIGDIINLLNETENSVDLVDTDDDIAHTSKPAEDTKTQTTKNTLQKNTGYKTDDGMNQDSIMKLMMTEQAEWSTTHKEQLISQPSYIDVTQVENMNLDQSSGTTLKKLSPQKDIEDISGSASKAQFIAEKAQHALEGCSEVKN